jgi:radical SAM protein with 4Fe4S-binding SPASM domain
VNFIDKNIMFCKALGVINFNKFTVLSHKYTGLWIKIPTPVYEYLSGHSEKNSRILDMVNECADEYTKGYITGVLKKLIDAGLMITENEKSIYQTTKLDKVSISLTNRCNLKCIHCSASAGDVNKGEPDFEQVNEMFDVLAGIGVENVCLTGGEIFVRHDIEDIIRLARLIFNGKISIMTNGTLINDINAKTICKCVDEVHISLDGFDNGSVELIRGAGVFDKVITSICILKKNMYNNITLSMVETKNLIRKKSDFYELCSQLNVKPVFRMIDPVGRARLNYDDLAVDVNNNQIPNNKELLGIKQNINGKCFCKASISQISIDEIGDVYPCENLQYNEYKIGNIFHEGKDVLNKISELAKVLNSTCIVDQIDGCKECDVRYFCATGCPGTDKNIFGDKKYRDSRCFEVKELYRKLVWE